MMDVLEKAGDTLDEKLLEEKLGVPCVKISALEESNLKELMEVAFKASQSPKEGKSVLSGKDLTHLIGDIKIAFKGKKVDNPLFHSIKLVENDEIETKMHEDLVPMVDEFKKTLKDEIFGDDIEAIIADERYKYISKNFAGAIKRHQVEEKEKVKENKSDRIDKVLTHRVWGLLIFATILFLVFH